MQIGIIKEVKDKEKRVALTPAGAKALIETGHQVMVQHGAGIGAGFYDAAYEQAGATLVDVERAWNAELVLKVKEPMPTEYPYLRNQILFTYLHLSGVSEALTEALLQQKTTAIAYETVEDQTGARPLLEPMSAVAGNMAVSMGSYYLASSNGGKGMQLGSVLGERYGKVVIIGDGVVGQHATRTAAAMGSEVFMFGLQPKKSSQIKHAIPYDFHYVVSTPDHIRGHLEDADLVIGAVLLPGAKAPHVVTEEMVMRMQSGSVIVDVSIDQGGCIETSRPTSHSDPIFITHGVIHYCVTNMPGAYPKTSTQALTRATLSYVLKLATHGLEVLGQDKGFASGVNTYQGYITSRPVAKAFNRMANFNALGKLL